MAFFPGSTGGIYRQFSMTLAIAIAFSALLALTLTPALCATLLKPHDQTERKGRIGAFFDRFFGRFNDWFGRTTDRYQGGVGKMLAAPLRWLGVFALMVRSEEHTSELQSLMRLSYAVFCLKKKTKAKETQN